MGSTVSTIWLAPSRLVEMRPQEVMPEHASVDIRRHGSNSRPRVLALVQPRHPDARAHPHYNSASPRAAPRHPHTARRATNPVWEVPATHTGDTQELTPGAHVSPSHCS